MSNPTELIHGFPAEMKISSSQLQTGYQFQLAQPQQGTMNLGNRSNQRAECIVIDDSK